MCYPEDKCIANFNGLNPYEIKDLIDTCKTVVIDGGVACLVIGIKRGLPYAETLSLCSGITALAGIVICGEGTVTLYDIYESKNSYHGNNNPYAGNVVSY